MVFVEQLICLSKQKRLAAANNFPHWANGKLFPFSSLSLSLMVPSRFRVWWRHLWKFFSLVCRRRCRRVGEGENLRERTECFFNDTHTRWHLHSKLFTVSNNNEKTGGWLSTAAHFLTVYVHVTSWKIDYTSWWWRPASQLRIYFLPRTLEHLIMESINWYRDIWFAYEIRHRHHQFESINSQ